HVPVPGAAAARTGPARKARGVARSGGSAARGRSLRRWIPLHEQPGFDAGDVGGGVGAGEVGAAGSERVEDAAVFGQGAFDRAVVGEAAPDPGSGGGAGEAVEQGAEVVVGAAGVDEVVGGDVGGDEVFDGGAVVELGHGLLESGEVLVGQVRAGLFDGDRFQQAADLDDLDVAGVLVEVEHEGEGFEQLLGLEGGDVGAVALAHIEHPDHGQRLDRL